MKIKLTRNDGSYPGVRSRYVLEMQDDKIGYLYAKPGIRPIIGYLIAKIKYK